MTYPNAYKGVKKVFIAQILTLIMYICLALTAGAGLTAVSDSLAQTNVDGMLAATGALGIATAVLGILALIINLVGLFQAGKDEPFFKTAFILTIIGLIFSVVQAALMTSNPDVAGYFEIAANILTVLIIVYVIYGIISLARGLHNEKLEKRGKRQFVLVVILLIVPIVLNIVGTIAFRNEVTEGGLTVFGIIALVGSILSIFAYICYLILLGSATKALKE